MSFDWQLVMSDVQYVCLNGIHASVIRTVLVDNNSLNTTK